MTGRRPRAFVGVAVIVIAGCSDAVPEETDVDADTPAVSAEVDQSARRTVVMTNIAVSATEAATFEQIHPIPGVITLSTTATSALLACPGGWGGTAVTTGAGSWGSVWLGEDCIQFDASSAATLPSVSTTDQHFAVAVLSPAGPVIVPELVLSYRAGDDSQACFVAEIERPCA